MKLWKLIAHHTHPEEAWTVIKATNTLAVGWECVGDMNHTPYASAAAIRDRIKEIYTDLKGQNHSNGGNSLWDFFHTMKKGDLVVISASGSQRGVFVVTGDYQYKAGGTS